MAEIKLMITDKSKQIPDEVMIEIDNLSYDSGGNGIEIYPKKDDFPMPWDAVCYIEDGFFIIDGDLGQQGNNKSWAKVGIPLDKVMNYLDLSIRADNADTLENLEAILGKYSWL